MFTQGKIDAFMCGPPLSLELRQKKIGHVLVKTTTDKPWSQYSCCLVASTKEFVRKYPVATKRALRAILKGVDLCANDLNRVARFMAQRGFGSYDMTHQVLSEIPWGSGERSTWPIHCASGRYDCTTWERSKAARNRSLRTAQTFGSLMS